MVNDLYLSAVYRPVAGAAPGILAKLLSNRSSRATASARRMRATRAKSWRKR